VSSATYKTEIKDLKERKAELVAMARDYEKILDEMTRQQEEEEEERRRQRQQRRERRERRGWS
jgi:CO/xanthine dehydrogenase Mo-binding subunit